MTNVEVLGELHEVFGKELLICLHDARQACLHAHRCVGHNSRLSTELGLRVGANLHVDGDFVIALAQLDFGDGEDTVFLCPNGKEVLLFLLARRKDKLDRDRHS